MTDVRFHTKQKARAISADDTWMDLAGQRETGGMYVQNSIDAWIREGRVFTTRNATIGTAIAGAVAGAITLTAPAHQMTVPTGNVLVPIYFKIAFAAIAGTINKVVQIFTDTNTYTSGGTATAAVLNVTNQNLKTSIVSNAFYAAGSAIVQAALTNPRVIDTWDSLQADAAGQGATNYEYSAVNRGFFHYIVGPASWITYVGAVGTTPTYEFVQVWAELDPATIS